MKRSVPRRAQCVGRQGIGKLWRAGIAGGGSDPRMTPSGIGKPVSDVELRDSSRNSGQVAFPLTSRSTRGLRNHFTDQTNRDNLAM